MTVLLKPDDDEDIWDDGDKGKGDKDKAKEKEDKKKKTKEFLSTFLKAKEEAIAKKLGEVKDKKPAPGVKAGGTSSLLPRLVFPPP